MTIYILEILLSLFGTSLLFHVQLLTVASGPAYRFLKRQIRWPGFPFSLRIVQNLLWSTQSKALAQSLSRSRCFFLEFSCFFDDPADVGNLISGSSAFSKSSLNIWKFTTHVKPGLENFEHSFTSLWDECNCAVVWAFFSIAFNYCSVQFSRSYSFISVSSL